MLTEIVCAVFMFKAAGVIMGGGNKKSRKRDDYHEAWGWQKDHHKGWF